MNINKLILVAAIFIFTMSVPAKGESVFGKATVTVIDEHGQPISDANVSIGFKHRKGKPIGQGWGDDIDYHPKKGITNDVGVFFGADNTSPEIITVKVNKNGYYESNAGVLFSVKKLDIQSSVLLKKKRNPSAMYAQRTGWMKIPAYRIPVGYDLGVGDWVTPFGNGKTSDLIFNFDEKPHEASYILTFPNKNDGIQEFQFDKEDHSSYRWPFEALENGYSQMLSKNRKYIGKKMETNLKDNRVINYLFRVRTIVDSKGQIISACYGKIKGEIELTTKGFVRFLYFFNPDGTRNLEYDSEKNLFLPSDEQKQKSEYDKYRVNDKY